MSVTINGNTTVYFTTATSLSFAVTPGQTLLVTVQAVNPSDNTVGGGTSAQTTIKALDAATDEDGDGMNNGDEDVAGTNPFSSVSVLRVTGITRPTPTTLTVTWSSVAGKNYQLETAPAPSGSYISVGPVVNATSTSSSETVTAATPAFYRVRVVP